MKAGFKALFLLFVGTFFACTDSAPTVVNGPGGSGFDAGFRQDAAGNGNRFDRGINQGPRRLVVIGQPDVFVLTGGTVNLQVSYEENRAPLVDQRVSFRMLDESGTPAGSAGIQGSALNSGSALTNRDGVASIRLRIGPTETSFIVEATAQGAMPVRWRVTVGNAGIGAFSIRLIYSQMTGRYTYRDFENAEVFLFNRQSNPQNCASLGVAPGQIFGADLVVERTPFNEVDNRVVVNNLGADAQYTIAAVAYSDTGAPLAFGCLDGQRVAGGMSTSMDLSVIDLDLQYKGRFEVIHRFNLRNALQTSNDQSLQTLNQLFDILQIIGGQGADRGDAVERLMCDLINLDGGYCRAISIFVTNGAIQNLLDGIIANEAPQLFTVFRALADVVKIIEEMTIVGEIEFVENTPDADGFLRNNEDRWRKFRFSWRQGCPAGQNCEDEEFTIGDIHSENGRETAIFAPFDAVVSGSTMEIKEHTLTVKYGLLLLGIAEYWVVPAVLNVNGPVTIQSMLVNVLPCQSIDNFLDDQSFCEDVLAAGLGEVLREVISGLSFSNDAFTLQGTVRPVDDDGDLVIDRLQGGIWRGRIGANSEFNGCFNGCRGLDCEPDLCLPPQ
ncbi:MAG: hypothetical protein VYA30_06395 [Myxococcota bacterium]|nr:hypothetical protein [Myxococcota bacterium]